MRVIYIDDDSDDREFFCDAVKIVDTNISCTTFDNSEEGITFLNREDILADFIFVDINMPRLNGYEAVREIRSIARLNKVPIIMLTTSISSFDRAEFDKQAIKILKKPNRMEDLVQSIKNILSQYGQLEEKQ